MLIAEDRHERTIFSGQVIFRRGRGRQDAVTTIVTGQCGRCSSGTRMAAKLFLENPGARRLSAKWSDRSAAALGIGGHARKFRFRVLSNKEFRDSPRARAPRIATVVMKRWPRLRDADRKISTLALMDVYGRGQHFV